MYLVSCVYLKYDFTSFTSLLVKLTTSLSGQLIIKRKKHAEKQHFPEKCTEKREKNGYKLGKNRVPTRA